MNKRRWGILLLAGLLTLPLCACGGKSGSSSSEPDSSAASYEEPSVSVIAPVAEPEPLHINPLTGEEAKEGFDAKRPFAVMLNDLRRALPQVGVSKADVIYEMVAEGGATRMMAVYQDLEGVGDLACIRSARHYYASLAYGHDAIFIHAGGSPQAYTVIDENNMDSVDLVNDRRYYKTSWRDQERKQKAGPEHSLFTSSENVLRDIPEDTSREHDSGYEVGWTFSSEAPAGGQPAAKVTVPFSGYKTGHFTYDEGTGRYSIEQHIDKQDIPYVDGDGDVAVTVSNVLVLYTDVNKIAGDDKGRMEVRTTGTGDGLLCRDGMVYEITWSRNMETACYSFLDKAGSPVPLAVGPSYINIVGTSAQVAWE